MKTQMEKLSRVFRIENDEPKEGEERIASVLENNRMNEG